ncbi:MAG TPA: RhuM family protein [Flavobacteriaceae bacterium]|nr:RhuM family protein [Flavobacteriaceae bacterium]
MSEKNNHAEHRLRQKAAEFYKASSDYDPEKEQGDMFFKELQKIIYYAMLYRTPEELIHERVDADKPKLGMLNPTLEEPTEEQLKIPRNYLTEDEKKKLDNTIDNFLMISEDQLKAGKSLTIKDWTSRLQGLLQMSGYSILLTGSNITKDQMHEKVKEELEKYLLR